MTYSNLVNDIFVSKIEIFIFFSLPDPSRIWKLLVSEYCCFHGNIIICISSVKICSPYNRTQLKTLVILPRLWLEHHICHITIQLLKNKDWTLWNKATWKYWPGTFMFQAALTKISKECHLSGRYKEPQNILGEPRKRGIHPNL